MLFLIQKEWNTNQIDYEPLIVILSEDVSKEYLMYLADKKISYIVTGCHKIDLNDALNILLIILVLKHLAL